MKSKQEEAIAKAGKKSRQCQNCKDYGHSASTCTNAVKKTESSHRGSRFDTMSADQ